MRSLEHETAVVPQIWHLEVANVLLTATRRERIREQEWPRLIAALGDLPIEVDSAARDQALGTTLHIAAQQGISACDAAYLELAVRRSLPIATLGRRLAEVCREARLALAV